MLTGHKVRPDLKNNQCKKGWGHKTLSSNATTTQKNSKLIRTEGTFRGENGSSLARPLHQPGLGPI
jgi:hypothetical protein